MMKLKENMNCEGCGEITIRNSYNQKYCPKCRKENNKRISRESKSREYHKDPQKFISRRNEWRKNNREYDKKYSKKAREERPEIVKALIKRWQQSHKDNVNAACKRYRDKNPEYMKERARLWGQNNPQKVRDYALRRQARKRGAMGTHTREEFIEVCKEYGWLCAYCGMELNIKNVTEDHIIPIVNGGSNNIDNMAPSCLKCNCSKNAKSVFKFMAYLKEAA